MPVTITDEQRDLLVKLLGELRAADEVVIDTAIVPGTGKTLCREDARAVARARRNMRQAERMLRILRRAGN